MSFLRWLGLGKSLAEPIKAVGDLYTTDKARIEAATKYELAEQKRGLAQLENNRLMIQSAEFFQSAWPALIAWTAGACIALYYIPQLVILNYLWIKQSIELQTFIAFPLDPTDILNLIYLLFGFGVHNVIKNKFKN